MSEDQIKGIVRLMAENHQLREDIKMAYAETRHTKKKMRATMTIRDHFAMAAITGIMANHTRDGYLSEYAKYAYEIADAMMEARG